MSLTSVEESLILATYFRGGSQEDGGWRSNTDEILTLSLFYTGSISADDCVARFAHRGYVQKLYVDKMWTKAHGYGNLTDEIDSRYKLLIQLLKTHPELIEGGGNFKTPAHPTFTACRLTDAGLQLASALFAQYPAKPAFPDWPDQREVPQQD